MIGQQITDADGKPIDGSKLTVSAYNPSEEVKKLFDGIASFFEPLIEGVKGIYYTVKDWIVNNIGIPKFTVFAFLRISLSTSSMPTPQTFAAVAV